MQPDVPLDRSPPGAEDVQDENGVDRSLIRASLDRTPTECVSILEDLLDFVESVHRVDGPVP